MQCLDMLLSVASLWMALRWLKGATPSLHSAVRLAMFQQILMGGHMAVHLLGGHQRELIFVYLVLEAAMLLLSAWRAWTSLLLLPVYGNSARLFIVNSLLEVRRLVSL